MYSLLIFVPALGLVRTSLDSNGEAVVEIETDMLRRQQEADSKAMANEALVEESVRREADGEAMEGNPYWQTFVAELAGRGTGEADFRDLDDKQELVGIALGGAGAGMGFGFPAGMSSSALAQQMFTLKFECMDAAAQQSLLGAKREIEWKSHGGRIGGKGIDHMAGHGIHVLHEKAGDYERALGARRYIMPTAVLNCQQLQLDINQRVFMDKQMLMQEYRQAAQQLAAAGYSEDEMEKARRGYHEQLFRDINQVPDLNDWEENHRKDLQELVENGSLKKAEDYGLVQKYASTMTSAAHSADADEIAGYFKFGSATIQNVRMADGKQVLAFKFTQDCKVDPQFRAEAQKLGPQSNINCKPGGKGLVLMHGEPTRDIMGDEGFTGDRLVMYLEQ